MKLCAVILLACLVLSVPALAQAPYYQANMVSVHSHYVGPVSSPHGLVARFGDSITYSGAFFKPLMYIPTSGITGANGTAADKAALTWFQGYVNGNCMSWQDDAVASSDGNYSGMDSSWPVTMNDQFAGKSNIAGWLTKLNPEMAVIMWGTNDMAHGISVAQYKTNMTAVVTACENNGTIPILTTIPPSANYLSTYPAYAQAMRDLATQLNVPLIDYNADILARRPGITWENTIIGSDGTHPTGNNSQNFSATALASDGYALRNYDTMTTMYGVYSNVMVPEPVSLSLLALGGLALLRRRK